MADTAFQTMYRDEYIVGFEQHESLLRQTCTTEVMVKGNVATFLVVDSGAAQAVTRGVNGLIPARADNLTQSSCTLVDWNDLVRKTNFNIFASQGNQRGAMQMTSVGVMNRRVDADIITELNTATNDTGATQTASLQLVLWMKTILGNNKVPFDGQIFGAITPAFEAYLLKVPEFTKATFVESKPLPNANTAFSDKPGYWNWLGVKWIVNPGLPGLGTTAEKCFMYHRSAIGHAIDKATMAANVGIDEEQNYSWARVTAFMNAKLLQNAGVVVATHDGSGFAPL